MKKCKMYSHSKLLAILLGIFVLFGQFFSNCSVVAESKILTENDKKNSSINLEYYNLKEMPEIIKKTVCGKGSQPVSVSGKDAKNLNSVTVVNKDGTNSLHIFPYDIKYMEGDKVKFISNKVVSTEGKDYEFQNNEGGMSKRFSKDPSIGVELEYKNKSVKMAPAIGLKNVGAAKNTVFDQAKNSINYDNVFNNNTSIKYISALNGIKEDIILTKYDGQNTFNFNLNTNGLVPGKLDADQMAIPLLDPETKKVVMIINQIVAFDSAFGIDSDGSKHMSINHKMILEPTGKESGYVLKIVVDKKFLQSDSTVYPVTIDPSVTTPSTYLNDTFVCGNDLDAGYWWSSMQFVGYHSYPTYGDTQMFVKLNNISDYTYISPSNITSVKYNIYEWSGQTDFATINVFDTASVWEYNTVTYRNKPDTYGMRQSFVNFPPTNTWASFDISSLFKDWLNCELGTGGSSKEFGFTLKANNPSTPCRFFSGSCDTTNPPTITVNYNEDASVTNDTYYIRNYCTGKYLDADQSGSNNVISYPFHGDKNQKWNIIRDNNSGLYKLYNLWPAYNNKALDVDTYYGTSNADLWDGNSTGGWVYQRLVQNPQDGTYRIMGSWGDKPNKALSTDTQTSGASNCVFSTYTGASTQKWVLERVTPLNMPSRTINMKVAVDTTYRNAYGASYLSRIQNDFSDNNFPFKETFNINLNQTYYSDPYLPNYQCAVTPQYEVCNSSCGSNCDTSHHRGWGRGLSVLSQNYTAASSPRELTVGIVGTGLCYVSGGVHYATGGLAQVGGQYSIIPKPNASHWQGLGDIRRQQHEISHLFNLVHNDGTCTPNQRCTMNGGTDSLIFSRVADIWCDACKERVKNFVNSNW